MPGSDLPPPFQKQCDFRFSTDQGCQSPSSCHIETPSGSTFLEDAIHVDGLRDTSERLGSQVLALEIALDQAIGRFTNSNRIWCCQSLDSGGDVWCFSKC